MKNLILIIILFLSVNLMSQNNNTNVSVKNGNESVFSKAIDRNKEMRDRKATNYLGEGIYELIRVGGGSF